MGKENELGQKQEIGDIVVAFSSGYAGVRLGVIKGFTPTGCEQIVTVKEPYDKGDATRVYNDNVSPHSHTIVINDELLFNVFNDGRAQKAKEVQYQLRNGSYKELKKKK